MSETESLPAVTPPAPPPHPLDGQWRVRAGADTYGPYSGHTIKSYLREGRIQADSEVAQVGSEEIWIPLRQDPRLGALVPPPRPSGALAVRDGTGGALVPSGGALGAETGVVVQIHQNFSASNAPLGEYDGGPRNPLFAGVLSLLIPGIGQFYNGRAGKGFAMLTLTVLLWLLWLGWLMNLIAAAEAYLDAQALTVKYHRRHGTPQATAAVL
jgi:TM2 domain-containing membrane protein YozV